MEKSLELKCSCGQTTHLVLDEAAKVYRYAVDPHGTDAVQTGCFNCHAPLDVPVLNKLVFTVGDDESGDGDDGDVITAEIINALKNKADIKAFAAEYGVDLSDAKNNDERKAVLIDVLLTSEEADDDDGDGTDGSGDE